MLFSFFLSNHSVQKEGFIQRELNYAWEISLEKPRNIIFLIPFRLDECEVPRYLRSRQWGDYFGEKKDSTYQTLLRSLQERYQQKLRLEAEERAEELARKQAEEVARLEEEKRKREQEAAREKAVRQAAENAAREKAEKETAEKGVKEKTKRDAIEKTAREKEQRKAVEKAEKEESELLLSDQKNAEVPRRINTRLILGIFGLVAIFLAGIFGFPYMVNMFSVQPKVTVTVTKTSRPFNATEAAFTSKVAPTQVPQTATSSALMTNVANGNTQIAAETQLSTEITDGYGVEMVLVPAGEFTMGSNFNNEDLDKKPMHSVYLDTFYIDKFEVTNYHYSDCVNAGTCQVPVEKEFGYYYNIPEFGNYPVVNVDWYMAKSYCEWRGAKLPSEAQWEKAARGTDERIYPWGNEYDDYRCEFANYEYGYKRECLGHAAEVDSYPAGVSPYGAYNMAGNVWEWVSSLYKLYPYISTDGREDLIASGSRVIRGGSWLDGSLDIYTYNRGNSMPSNFNNRIGFRCARDVTP